MEQNADQIQALAQRAFSENNIAQAAELCRNLLLFPNNHHAFANYTLGVIAHQQGKVELALQLACQALENDPHLTAARINVCIALRQLGRKDEAFQEAMRAVSTAPTHALAWHTASFLLIERREYNLALDAARRALALDANNPVILCNAANAALTCGELSSAYTWATQSVLLQPKEAAFHQSLGQVLRAAGYPLKASASFETACRLKGDLTDAYSALASCFCMIGRWSEGLDAWEHRPYDKKRLGNLVRWQGEKVNHLFLHAEQGMGDALQYLRFVDAVALCANRLTIQVPAPLLSIVSKSFPQHTIIAPTDNLPEDISAYALIMSLPKTLNISLNELPSPFAVVPDEKLAEKWRVWLGKKDKPFIGISWAGNPDHSNDYNRSAKFSDLDPILQQVDAHFISLQNGKIFEISKDQNADQVRVCLSEGLDDTAALIANLDIVISVDTMIAHMAATMNKPVFMMTAFDPDWRWFLEKTRTPWYKTLRIFRQKQPRHWLSVASDIAKVLCACDTANINSLLGPDEDFYAFAQQNAHALNLPFEH